VLEIFKKLLKKCPTVPYQTLAVENVNGLRKATRTYPHLMIGEVNIKYNFNF